MSALTLSGNEITDAVRLAGVQGDGRAYPDSSFYIGPAATNLVTNGGCETNATGYSVATGGETIARDTAQKKFGAASLKVTTVGLTNNEGERTNTITGLTAQTYTYGVWVLAPAGVAIRAQIDERDNTDTFIAASWTDITATGAWQRVSVTRTFTTGDRTRLRVIIPNDTTASTSFWVDGVGLVTGAVDIPYIETDGGTASRGASRVQMPVSSRTFSTTQGWVALRAQLFSIAANVGVFEFADDANNRILLYLSSATNVGLFRVGGGAGGGQGNKTMAWSPGDYVTIVGAWDSTGCKVALDGGVFGTRTASSTPTLTATSPEIGALTVSLGAGNGRLNGNAHWFACGSGVLVDADSVALHAFGNTDPTPQQLFSNLSAAARPTAVVPFNDATFSMLLAVPPARITGPWRVWPARRGRR